MSGDPPFVAVLLILFLATLVRSSFGFGEALVAVPLVALLLPVEVAHLAAGGGPAAPGEGEGTGAAP